MPLVTKPFSNIITFTRASSATFVGSNGLIQTATTNIPRFDYDPITLAAKGLLIEEQRTNLLTYSEDFSNSAWVKAFSTLSNNTAISPDGTTTAEKSIVNNGITLGVSSGAGLRQDWTKAASPITYTQSLFAKAAEFNSIFLFLSNLGASSGVYGIFNLATGTAGATASFGSGFSGLSTRIENYGNGWYRCILTVTSDSSTGMRNSYFPADTVATTGNGTSGVLVWGAQLEAGSFATSYIPTVASQVTRSADVASVNTLSPWYNASEGTLYAEYTPYAVTSDSRFASIDANTTANRMMIWGTSGSARTIFDVSVASVNQASIQTTGTFTTNTTKSAGAYKVNDFAFSVNGAAALTDTSGSIPVATQLVIGSSGGSSANANAHIRNVAYYPRRLSNAELQALTA